MNTSRYYQYIFPGTIAFSVVLMLIGLSMGHPEQLLSGLWKIVTMQDLLITDYIHIAGPAAAFVNAGLVTIISILIIKLAKDPFNGFTIVEMGLMAGFSLFGKNVFNIWPIILGTWLYARYQKEPFSKYASVALLTDSSADLRWDQARENNIFFVPLRILCEDGEYLDGVNITGPDIYQRLHNGELPQTSLPRVEDFSAKLREIFDLGYDGVIAVMLSSGLSGTYNLARILAGECAEQGYAMKVFDSVSGALGQGMTVLQLAEDIKNGMDWEELTERRAPQLIANTYPFFSVDTLEYLVKGGRIGKVTAMAGTMLQIKPIITFAPDGQLQSVAKVRGRHQVMRKLVDMAVDRCGEHKRYNLAVAHGGAPEEMETVRQMLTEALPNSDHLWDGEIDGTLSVYIGDGVLGAAVQVLD